MKKLIDTDMNVMHYIIVSIVVPIVQHIYFKTDKLGVTYNKVYTHLHVNTNTSCWASREVMNRGRWLPEATCWGPRKFMLDPWEAKRHRVYSQQLHTF